jgi:hypothetical protein
MIEADNIFVPEIYVPKKIKSIKRIRNKGKVYDLTVNKNHTYCIGNNNIVGHNSDMGARAKAIATFFRTFDVAFEKTNISFIFANKLYTNIGNVWNPYKVTGGVNVEYNPSLSIRLMETSESDDVSETDMKNERERRKTALGSSIKSVRATIQKSRFGTELRNVRFLIDMSVGPVRHSGLFGLLIDFGVIKKSGGAYYELPEIFDKKFMKKDFIPKIIEGGDSYLKKIQELLEKREIEIYNARKEFQMNSSEIESFEVEDENYEEMKKAMIRDAEK